VGAEKRIYLDYNASAPLRQEARVAMLGALQRCGNASSVHAEGRQARQLVEEARAGVAMHVGTDPRNVTFTASGSEANVSVLAPAIVGDQPTGIDRVLVGATEHPSVLAGGRFPRDRVATLPVDGDGVIDLAAMSEALARSAELSETVLVSVMLANNETGAIQPITEISKIAHQAGAIVHTDAAQAIGRMPVNIGDLGVDFLTLSSHKIGGPQGAGAVVMKSEGVAFTPLITGGGQERRRRAGTENVAAIAGFGAAILAAKDDLAKTNTWRSWRDGLAAAIATGSGTTIFSERVSRLPQTLCVGVAGATAETLLIALDLAAVAVSSGSACSSGKVSSSHVLTAMGVDPDLARSAIRISFGWDTRENDLEMFQTTFSEVLERVERNKGDHVS